MKIQIGDKVTHRNEGQCAGSAGVIKVGPGVVTGIVDHGMDRFGAHVVGADVSWSSGEQSHALTYLLNRATLEVKGS